MAFNLDDKIEQLTEIYREGFLNVLDLLQKKQAAGQNTVFLKDQLKGIMGILEQIDEESSAWIQDTIPKIYQNSYAEVMALIQKTGMQRHIRPEFAQIHQRAIDVVAQNMQDNLREALQFAGRRVNDEFRKIGLEATGAKLAAGRTVRDMQKDLIDRFTVKGIPGFEDRLGRVWSLDRYSLMVARTTTREISSISTLNACKEFDNDYVYIPPHTLDKEDICANYADKVYCISGNDPKYPKFTEDCRPPYHPNCRHTLQPYVPGIRELTDDEIDDLIKEAPEVLAKIGAAAKIPSTKKVPAAPKAEEKKKKEKSFDLESFRQELRELSPKERYNKSMKKAKELIEKDLKIEMKKAKPIFAAVEKSMIGGAFNFLSGEYKASVSYNLAAREIAEKLAGAKTLKEQYDITKTIHKYIRDKGFSVNSQAAADLIHLRNSMQKRILIEAGIDNDHIKSKWTKQTLDFDARDRLDIEPTTNIRDYTFKQRMKEATDFLTTYIYGAAAPGRGIELNKLRSGARAYASGNTINIASNDDASIFVHEAGHVIHEHNSEIKDLVKEFFRDRTEGDILKTIYAGTTEKGYRDDFFSHYIGKVYSWEAADPKGTEVFSMGLQEMFKDPAGFYIKDPEHFTLIYSIMRGLF